MWAKRAVRRACGEYSTPFRRAENYRAVSDEINDALGLLAVDNDLEDVSIHDFADGAL
jgi:hypothetical protein